jgi:hypothetical protein
MGERGGELDSRLELVCHIAGFCFVRRAIDQGIPLLDIGTILRG